MRSLSLAAAIAVALTQILPGQSAGLQPQSVTVSAIPNQAFGAPPFLITPFAGSVIANAAIVPAGAFGSIDAYANDDTDLIVDINGYFVPPASNSLQFYPLPPCRVLDTRNPDSTFGGPSILGGDARSFPLGGGACGAENAAAYSLNVTVVPNSTLGYLTAWPTGRPQPVVSTLNSLDGTVLANAAIVPAGTNGEVSFFASDTTDLIVDINGFFAPPGSGGFNFYPVTPCRLVDRRNPDGTFGGPVMIGQTTRSFPLTDGACGLFGTAQAYSLNITAVPQSTLLVYLSTWPARGAQPVVSTLNALRGQVVANAAIVPAGAGGEINVFVTDAAQVMSTRMATSLRNRVIQFDRVPTRRRIVRA